MQVVAAAGEALVGLDAHVDVQVAGRAAAFTDLALMGEAYARFVRDASGNRDPHLARCPDAAVPHAGRAGVGDHRSVSLAPLAGRGGHHLAEHRAHDLLPEPLAVAVRAGGGLRTVGGARAPALLAQTESIDLDVRGAAEDRRLEIDGGARQRVAARLGAGNGALRAAAERSSEELAEDVGHVTHAESRCAAESARIGVVGVHAGIVHAALVGVGEHRVGVVHFLELVFVFGAGDIGMILAAHLAIRFFDLIVAGRLVDAQHLVVICHCSFFLVGVRGAIVP